MIPATEPKLRSFHSSTPQQRPSRRPLRTATSHGITEAILAALQEVRTQLYRRNRT
jgi:hypothetical protein